MGNPNKRRRTVEEPEETTPSDDATASNNTTASSCDADDRTDSSLLPSSDVEKEEGLLPEPPKFKVFQKIYARDNDGLVYEAVVRRCLYGPQYHKQVQLGMTLTEEEAVAQLQQNANELPDPTWHYFVHFNKWSAKFDRFVSQDDCFEATGAVKAYATKVQEEHTALRKSMMRKVTGKKLFQTVDGAEFLRAWRKKLDWINAEVKIGEELPSQPDASAEDAKKPGRPPKPHKRPNTSGWTAAAVTKELALRKKGLTQKRPPKEASTIALPFTLKKVLVEQWEIITQCDMVSCVPASVSVQGALDRYLQSKGVSVRNKTLQKETTRDGTPGPGSCAAVTRSEATVAPGGFDAQEIKQPEPVEKAQVEKQAGDASTKGTVEKVSEAKPAEPEEVLNTIDMDAKNRLDQEWMDVADGIALMFDEALAKRLLYQEELAQIQVLDALPDFADKRYSEIFGCEHLLRLFVRLPPLLTDSIPEDEARPIIAKVNDFIRFIYKNQTTLLSQSYRKLNEAERTAQHKLSKISGRKRKRLEESKALPAFAPVSSAGTTAADGSNV